jgi:15-cis-phytoene synthase
MMDNAAYCQSLVREADPDRFFATLFAPAAARPALFALYAFNAEVARIRDHVSEPIPGEIRLTWWREVLEGERATEAVAHPVAGALLAAIRDYRLPAAPLARLTEARIFDLYDDPMPSVGDLEGYAGETSSVLLRLASLVVAGGEDPGGADVAGHGGVAYAIAGLLRALPFHASRGQIFLPVDVMARHGVRRDWVLAGRADDGLLSALAEMRALARHHLKTARAALGELKAVARPAFLPGALVEPYLEAMEGADYDPFRTPVEIAQWRRQFRLWRAARSGRPLG